MPKVSVQAPKIQDYPRGDARTLNIPVTQSDGVTPLNLTGYSVFFTLNANEQPTDDGTDATAIIKKKQTSFITPAGGSVPSVAQIALLNSDTQPLTEGDYWYDVQVVDGSGNPVSLARNTFSVIDDITTRTS